MNVYFDTSVYDRLEKKLVGCEEAEALSAAVHRGDINVYFGFPNSEELFGQWDNKLTRPATSPTSTPRSALSAMFERARRARSRNVVG